MISQGVVMGPTSIFPTGTVGPIIPMTPIPVEFKPAYRPAGTLPFVPAASWGNGEVIPFFSDMGLPITKTHLYIAGAAVVGLIVIKKIKKKRG
jgi:hypothetical protein